MTSQPASQPANRAHTNGSTVALTAIGEWSRIRRKVAGCLVQNRQETALPGIPERQTPPETRSGNATA
ncbi:hypothetical protein WAI453_009871 [Rhynchosporium graminicola]